MALQRKQQIMGALEATEGQKATLSASDTLLVYDPQIGESGTRNARVPASPSLGRRKDTIGITGRQLTFGHDFQGGGTGVAPPWARLARACGCQQLRVLAITVTSTPPFQIGEKVYVSGEEATNYGIALNSTGSGTLYVAWLVGDSGSGAETLVGKRSTASSAYTGPGTQDDFFYRPTSKKEVQITLAAWSGGPTIAVGSVLTVSRSSVIVGSAQVKKMNSTTDLEVVVQYGDIQNGDTILSPVAESTTVNATPTPLLTPSLTFRHNLDGFARDLIGARGNMTIEGTAGGPMRMNYTFDGVEDSTADLDFSTGAGLSAILPPRLLGIQFGVGIASALVRAPVRGFTLDLGNQVGPRLDANASGGIHHYEITDREPTLTLSTDTLGASAVNWIGLRDAGTIIRIGLRVGTASGNVMCIIGTALQVHEVSDEDAEGVAGQTVTLGAKFLDDGTVVEEGDNEFIIAQTSA